jgi:N-methylhydantoinase B
MHDQVLVEVVRNHLIGAASEMKQRVMRTAMSSVWREAGDLSCALLTASGEVVAQGIVDLPCHLGTMPFSVAGALAVHPAETLVPGDALFHNDPLAGNNHLPDCIMIMPIFWMDTLVAYCAVRGHWTDIGGAAAGSYTTATTELLQEGLRIPPVRIFREGRLDHDLLSLVLANVRLQDQARGDFWAQYAGCQLGLERMHWLCRRYGAEAVTEVCGRILDLAEERTRREIDRWPDGSYVFEQSCDGDGFTEDPFPVVAEVQVHGSDVTVDFSGTTALARGGINAPLASTTSAVYFAVKAAADPWNPTNSGCYRPVTVTAPEGTIVNAPPGAPVVASNHETANIIADAVLGALAQVVPERVCAAGSGSAAVTMIAGRDPHRRSKPFAYLEAHGGALGARPEADGENAVRVGVGNTGNQPIEVVEAEYPVRIRRYELVADAGGAGRFRGGCPAVREYELLADCEVTVTAERTTSQPYGLAGGQPGAAARFELIDETGRSQLLPAKTRPLAVRRGSRLLVTPAAGGGHGPPNERASDLHEEDLRNGYATR